MKTVEVCLSPELIHQHDLKGKIAVVVDIFRATSCMVTGLAEGVEAIYPVSTIEECKALGELGLITAGERGGQKVDGFNIGNSPYQYLDPMVRGQKVAVTTTNGTIAIEKSKAADEILIGAFLNISATADYLLSKGKSILVLCAGWKGTPNLEDTLYAGALIDKLIGEYVHEGDSSRLSHDYYLQNKNDLVTAAKKSGHAHRLARFGIKKDADFCMQQNVYDSVVRLERDQLVKV